MLLNIGALPPVDATTPQPGQEAWWRRRGRRRKPAPTAETRSAEAGSGSRGASHVHPPERGLRAAPSGMGLLTILKKLKQKEKEIRLLIL